MRQKAEDEEQMSNGKKIITFPGLEKRLLQLGLECLEQHQFAEATDYLRQAREISPNNPEIEMTYLLALYENGDYRLAKKQCETLLTLGIGDYFEVTDLYLMILIQLKEHRQVKETIEMLIEENEIPIEKYDHYQHLLQFSKKVIANENVQEKLAKTNLLFDTDDIRKQTLTAIQLQQINIQPYISEISRFLNNPAEHPFIQTMVLNALKEQGFHKKILVAKFHLQKEVVPAELPPVFETPLYVQISNRARDVFEQKNPTLYAQLKTMMHHHFFLLYPFDPSPFSAKLWLAAYHFIGEKMYQPTIQIEKVAEKYEVNLTSLTKAVHFLQKLEAISSPKL